mmetsp:Transcript_24620/g.44442  ORF Transcript_24620/g.44442 Transcript_24620/m.44442 type:complete len:274 (+) Transcript_24620:77-898(+)|eukprot:CAMPEP_0201599570 /NCGR_PEP_ID=MMETSP0492-20130828/964_1 /ASSEMBLY_ACC=CAM_ASM_000837 /TAXON_ID=420259 /ORGANISM="Thalassiosira gravida, Strain GMp14c1" /LENGTH=273 /DNA_ID=CAMNT_0048062159 /DNA_START=59 /DNA_END=883 /DNA_ORIENTATION=+
MARGKGKRGGGRGSGKRFAAQSAEEIEQRNARLEAFDAARAKRRADADDDKDDDDDGSVDSAQRDAEREAMLVGRRVAGISVGDGGEGGEDGEWVEKEYKPKGLEGLIEVDNPNKAKVKMTKLKDMDGSGAAPMTRKEREEKEKEAKAAAYRKRHEAGLTEEYKRDMSKLNEVKARRAAAQAKVDAEKEAEEFAEEERKKAVEDANAASAAASDDEGKKKKKKGKSVIPKIDKIAIKKMKPAQLKEVLKERGLEIQGNAKALQARLLKYEQER